MLRGDRLLLLLLLLSRHDGLRLLSSSELSRSQLFQVEGLPVLHQQRPLELKLQNECQQQA